TRCQGPLALGDLMYTTTLLPGEKVRLSSSDRHTRFSFDSESKLSYLNETTSEESYYAAGMAYGMSNLSVLDTTNASSSFSSSSVSGGGGVGIDLGIFSIGGGASGSSYAREFRECARPFPEPARGVAPPAHGGEHSGRGLDIDRRGLHPRSSTRRIGGPIRIGLAHLLEPQPLSRLTFLFYRINKCQTVKFEIVRIDRRVDDS